MMTYYVAQWNSVTKAWEQCFAETDHETACDQLETLEKRHKSMRFQIIAVYPEPKKQW